MRHRRTLLCLVLGVTAFGVHFIASAPARRAAAGRAGADDAWSKGRAVRLVRENPTWRIEREGLRIESQFDQHMGLRRQVHGALMGRPPESGDAFNARVDELFKLLGPPEWSMHRHLASPEELVVAYAQDDLKPINSLPANVTPAVTLSRSRGNHAEPAEERLDIKTPQYSYRLGFYSGAKSPYVGRMRGRPDLLLVRAGRELVVMTDAGVVVYQVEPVDDFAGNARRRQVRRETLRHQWRHCIRRRAVQLLPMPPIDIGALLICDAA